VLYRITAITTTTELQRSMAVNRVSKDLLGVMYELVLQQLGSSNRQMRTRSGQPAELGHMCVHAVTQAQPGALRTDDRGDGKHPSLALPASIVAKHRHSAACRETRPGLIGARQGCRNRWTVGAGQSQQTAGLTRGASQRTEGLSWLPGVVLVRAIWSGVDKVKRRASRAAAAKRTVRKGHDGSRPCALVPSEQPQLHNNS
jgi:hypothetical protein